MSSAPEVEVVPAPRVVVDRAEWRSDLLGLTIPSPPTVLRRDSADSEVASVRRAVHLGLASTRWRRASTPWARLGAEASLPVKPTIAVALPRSVVAAIVVVTSAFVRIHAVPVAIVALAVLSAPFVPLAGAEALAGCAAIVLASFVVHELGHVVALRVVARRSPAVFVMSRSEPHLVRLALPVSRDVAVTLAGPLAPMVVQLVATGWFLQGRWAEAVVASIVSISHVVSLAVPVGDGAELRAALSALEEQPPGVTAEAPPADDAARTDVDGRGTP